MVSKFIGPYKCLSKSRTQQPTFLCQRAVLVLKGRWNFASNDFVLKLSQSINFYAFILPLKCNFFSFVSRRNLWVYKIKCHLNLVALKIAKDDSYAIGYYTVTTRLFSPFLICLVKNNYYNISLLDIHLKLPFLTHAINIFK